MSDHDPSATPSAGFPKLTPANHRVIGPADYEFNCIAWACGNVKRWWQPGPHFYWPVSSDPNNASIENLLGALSAVGFVPCPDETPEPGFEKIAVYATATEYTHTARQLPTGKWSSKLGTDALIEHDTAEDVAGGIYGSLRQFMKRPLPTE